MKALAILATLFASDIIRPARHDPGLKTIPLDTVFATIQQEELPYFGSGPEKAKLTTQDLFRQSNRTGASNVFLVRGDTIESAIRGTWEVFCGSGSPVTQPVSPDRLSSSKKFWLVAFLGVTGGCGDFRIN
ncbi:MAG: hypothetical protein L0215_12085, partial [Gemmataceae bacterium]|nr:hypothetical protein [Gemmataceae bacterium]